MAATSRRPRAFVPKYEMSEREEYGAQTARLMLARGVHTYSRAGFYKEAFGREWRDLGQGSQGGASDARPFRFGAPVGMPSSIRQVQQAADVPPPSARLRTARARASATAKLAEQHAGNAALRAFNAQRAPRGSSRGDMTSHRSSPSLPRSDGSRTSRPLTSSSSTIMLLQAQLAAETAARAVTEVEIEEVLEARRLRSR